MTHITQEQATKLDDSLEYEIEKHSEFIHALCNAAVQTYLDSLSAELPEPKYYWEPEEYVKGFRAGGNSGFSTNTGPAHGWKITHYFTRDQLTQALAARDAKWQGDYDALDDDTSDDLAQCSRYAKQLEAERDAALELAQGRLEQMNADRKQALVWRDALNAALVEIESLKVNQL